MWSLFAVVNVVSSLFDVACVRYVFTILGLCLLGRDGCREPIPLVSGLVALMVVILSQRSHVGSEYVLRNLLY